MSGFRFYVGGRLQGAGLSTALDGISKTVNVWGALQVRRIVEAFRQQGHESRGGPRWANWSPAYAKNRAKHGRTNVLVNTGILRNSIVYRQETSAARGKINVTIGTNIRYAKFLDEGVARKSRKVKAHKRYRKLAHGKAIKSKERAENAVAKANDKVKQARKVLKSLMGKGLNKTAKQGRKAVKSAMGRKAKANTRLRAAIENAKAERFKMRIGGHSRVGGMPARPIIVFTQSDREDLSQRIDAFIQAKIGQQRKRGA